MADDRAADVMVTIPKTLGSSAKVGDVRRELRDDHVHMLLVVDGERRLLTTIERPDVPEQVPDSAPATSLGTVCGRTTAPTTTVTELVELLAPPRRRRLAVVDGAGHLLGLVCLKRSRTGFCSDAGVTARAVEGPPGNVPCPEAR